MSRSVSSPPPSDRQEPDVVAINDEAALYLALADAIHGTAVGLSPAAQLMLRHGLKERFGTLFEVGGDSAVDELIRLATEPRAA